MNNRPAGEPGSPPRLLQLSHAVIWRDHGYLVKVGLDGAGEPRSVAVSPVRDGAPGDLVDAGVALTARLAHADFHMVLNDTHGHGGPLAFLIGATARVASQAGPIARYAHGLVPGR